MTSTEDAVEEVEQEDELRRERYDCRDTHEHVQVGETTEGLKVCPCVISSWETRDTNVVHREEHHVNTYERKPEVKLAEAFVHHSTEHFREPVIDTGKHSEERCATHYKVEVSYYEVCVVKLNIDGRVTQEDTGDTTCKEERYETDREQHAWCESDVTFPECSYVVEDLHRRRHRNDQRQGA